MLSGNIPSLEVSGVTIPHAWENAVKAVWYEGIDVKTQYDKPEDPPSKDATVMITVEKPFCEPRIHKNFPGGPEELEAYRQEVCEGIHNHWINPKEDKWTYTYHERLFSYRPVDDLVNPKFATPFTPIDQIDYIVNYLAGTPHTRRAQAITWMPTCDPQTYDPPCLQRLWFRILENDKREKVLNMNSHWRSRDLYKAWFMNVYAITDLQRIIAEKISDKIGEIVKVGRYVDITDSLHIYGSYFEEAEPEIIKMADNPLPCFYGCDSTSKGCSHIDALKRVWKSTHPAFKMMTEEARENLQTDPDFYAKGDKK